MRFSYLAAAISSSVLVTLTSFGANSFDAIATSPPPPTTIFITVYLIIVVVSSFSLSIFPLFFRCLIHSRCVFTPIPKKNMCEFLENSLRIVFNCNQYMSYCVCVRLILLLNFSHSVIIKCTFANKVSSTHRNVRHHRSYMPYGQWEKLYPVRWQVVLHVCVWQWTE